MLTALGGAYRKTRLMRGIQRSTIVEGTFECSRNPERELTCPLDNGGQLSAWHFKKILLIGSFAELGATARIDYMMISLFNYRRLHAAE